MEGGANRSVSSRSYPQRTLPALGTPNANTLPRARDHLSVHNPGRVLEAAERRAETPGRAGPSQGLARALSCDEALTSVQQAYLRDTGKERRPGLAAG